MTARKKIAASAGLLAAAMLLALPGIKRDEGLRLKSYEDVAGVFTICYGHAYVKPGTTMTKKQCDALAVTDTYRTMVAVYEALTVPISNKTIAAHTRFAFNIGSAGYRHSSTLRLTNAGQAAEGCQAMYLWDKMDGVHCTNNRKKKGCPGLMDRRKTDVQQCVEGLNDKPL